MAPWRCRYHLILGRSIGRLRSADWPPRALPSSQCSVSAGLRALGPSSQAFEIEHDAATIDQIQSRQIRSFQDVIKQTTMLSLKPQKIPESSVSSYKEHQYPPHTSIHNLWVIHEMVVS